MSESPMQSIGSAWPLILSDGLAQNLSPQTKLDADAEGHKHSGWQKFIQGFLAESCCYNVTYNKSCEKHMLSRSPRPGDPGARVWQSTNVCYEYLMLSSPR